MKDVVIAGRVTSALTHFALVGACTIAEHETGCRTRLWWRDGVQSEAVVRSDLELGDISEAVRAHAARVAGPESWLRQRFHHSDGTAVALFAPRVKPPADRVAWGAYERQRDQALAGAAVDELDRAMIVGMGEPGWWRVTERESRPDDGASRWDMKTRNRGEELVTHRLLPLSEAVAGRSIEQVAQGLSGEAVVDETGSGTSSRTSSGLTTPRPTDSAVAWCALWAMTQVPPTPSLRGVGATPGLYTAGALHPSWAALPVLAVPTSQRVWGRILRSPSWGRVHDRPQIETLDTSLDRDWLSRQGVVAWVRFPVHLVSGKAPERQVDDGELSPLP